MGVFEINLLDYYFSEQHKLSSSNLGHNLIEQFLNMKIFKDIQENYSDIIKPSLQNLKNLGDRPLQEELIQFKKAIQQQPRLKSFLMDVLKCSHENIDAMWKSFYYYDVFLFKHFSMLMYSVKKEDRPSLLGIIEDFQKKRKEDLSLLQQIQSPLDIFEVKTESRLKIKGRSFTFKDLYSPQWYVIQRLNQKSLYDQKINVHSWCKQLGELIEIHFKRTIYFIFLINYLIRTKKSYISTVKLKSLSINDVFSKFSKHHNRYENVSNLRHIRNSIHHGDFTWESYQPIENSLIRFVDRNWAKTISFEQLLVIYFKLVILLSTFELVVMNTHLSLLDDSRPIDQILKDVGNQIFQQFLNPLREWLEESEDNQ